MHRFVGFHAIMFVVANMALWTGFLTFGFVDTGKWLILFAVSVIAGIRFQASTNLKRFATGVGCIVVVAFVSCTYSADFELSFMKAVALGLVLSCSIIFIASTRSRELETSRQMIEGIAWGFVLMGGFYFFTSVLLYLIGVQNPPFLREPMFTGLGGAALNRFSGIMCNPNQLGICAAIFAPMAVAKGLQSPTRNFLCWVLFATIVYAVWLSNSRNALLSIAFGSAAAFVFCSSKQNWLGRAAVVALLGLAIIILNSDSLKGYFTRGSASESVEFEKIAENRLSRWRAGIRSIEKRPVLGQGFSIGGVPVSGHVNPVEVDQGYPLHNSYLQIMQEIGVVGLLIVLVPILAAGYSILFKRHVVIDDPPKRFVFAGFAGIVLAGTFNAFFESWLIAPGSLGTFPFWTAVGIVILMTHDSIPAFATRDEKFPVSLTEMDRDGIVTR